MEHLNPPKSKLSGYPAIECGASKKGRWVNNINVIFQIGFVIKEQMDGAKANKTTTMC